MIIKWGKIRRFLFGISLIDIDSGWKNVPNVETLTRKKLRFSTIAFATGVNTAIEVGLSELLIGQLEGLNDNYRGFSYEGAGMGLAIVDYFRNKGLVNKFLQGEGANYSELIYIGMGGATAVLKKDLRTKLIATEPMQRWWIADGYGFFTGTYKWEDTVEQLIVPTQIKGYALRAFDRGLGRRMWFALSGEVEGVASAIAQFPESRQADLWSGIGLASTFAGGVNETVLVKLKELSGDFSSYVALGSTMAAKYRYTAGNIIDYTNSACFILCGMTAVEAGKMVTKTIEQLNVDPDESLDLEKPAFEIMLENIRENIRSCVV